MNLRISLSIAVLLLIFNPAFSQRIKVENQKYRLVLKLNNKITDSVYFSSKSFRKKDTLWTFSYFTGRLPDRCPWSSVRENKYLISGSQFLLLDSLIINVRTKCGNLFHAETACCIAIRKSVPQKRFIHLLVGEYDDPRRIKIPVNNFNKLAIEEYIQKELNRFIIRKECPVVKVQ